MHDIIEPAGALTEADLRRRWPAAFNDARLPLKLSINVNMGLARGNEAMSLWVSHPVYLRNTIEGGARVGLDGEPWGQVTFAEQLYAYVELMRARDELNRRANRAGVLTADERAEFRRRSPKKPTHPRQSASEEGDVS